MRHLLSFIKRIAVKRYVRPVKVTPLFLYKEGIVERNVTSYTNKSFNIHTAVSFKQLFNMLSVFRRISSVKEAEKVVISQRALFRDPFKLCKLNFVIFVTFTSEQEPICKNRIFINLTAKTSQFENCLFQFIILSIPGRHWYVIFVN